MVMKQQTLAMAADAQSGFEQHRKPTRRDEFLKTMDALVPWAALCDEIAPHYPKAGNGRPPIGLERMLRIHFIQHWFNLADLACEEALYDSASLRRFVGIDLGCEPVPDATTMLRFRRLLNEQKLGEALFARVGKELQARGIKVNTGTIVDATIIGAPSSTKNADKARDPEMHQTRKGQQWYFGMKLHIGVDSQTGLSHSAVVTAANVHDKHPLPDLLHGNEQRVYGDSAYASQKALIASKAPRAKDLPISVRAAQARSMKCSGPRTATSRGCVLGLSMSLRWSSGCGDSPRCAIADYRRTPHAHSPPWRWPTSTCAGGLCRDSCARKGQKRGLKATRTAQMAGAGRARPEKPCNLVQHGKFGCLVQRSPNVLTKNKIRSQETQPVICS